MKFLKILLSIIVLVAVVGLFLPSVTHVERATVINAPQPLVFSYLNDFSKFNEWSPWAKKDPNTRYTFTGPDKGVGSKMAWESEHEHVGNGSQEIIESVPFEYIKTHLDFGPDGSSNANYRLSHINGTTQIVWSFDMEHSWNPIERYFGLMMDSMLGPEYENGLASLKQVVELAKLEESVSDNEQ